MVEKQNVELKLIHMEDVVSKEVEWLWYPYIPYGKITIIEGDPGEGKTTLVLKLAAALSRGLPLPCDDDKEYEPIHIIYQTAEDGIEDTIKPRLEKAGADCSMIRVIDETDKELSMTDDRLELAIIETGAVRSISELEIVSVLFPEMLKVSTSLRPLSPSSYT